MRSRPATAAATRSRARRPGALALLPLLLGCPDPADDPKTPDETATTTVESDPSSDVEAIPGFTEPWLREETATPGSITLNELLYNAATDGGVEWIELHNPMALDMDLSGWSLAGGVSWSFPEGTVIAAGGFLVIASDSAALAADGFADALGPYDGELSDAGARLELRNNSGRLIDTLTYTDDEPWPVQADGSGLSLAKVDLDAASGRAENWTASAELGGTPGATNHLYPLDAVTTVTLVALDATWAYDLSGGYPAADWNAPDYDDSAWARAPAVFFAGATEEDELATIRATADNYFAVYLGHADGAELRLVDEDSDGDWTTVESVTTTVTPEDHLYLAAWEAPGDNTSPQMTIAEVELPTEFVGTDASAFEWVLGPTDACPGTTPPDPPPTEAALSVVIADANAAADWADPGVEDTRNAATWGWAVSGSFTDAAHVVWADTFDSESITNIENTYVLLRSKAPLLGDRGTTELPELPGTVTFRTAFTLSASPADTTLALDCQLDDGAIFFLNGVEVLRQNMPSGAVDASTLATDPVTDSATFYEDIPSDALVRGDNVLAVEVHQAEPEDTDLTFGCALSARITSASGDQTVVLNEIGAASDSPFGIELRNVGASAESTTGLVLVSSEGDELLLPEGALDAGELQVVDDVGFDVASGDVLFLYSADRSALLDAVRAESRHRGRDGDGGPWRFLTEASLGEAKVVDLSEDIVINEVLYNHAPDAREGEPYTPRSDEWIELYNRGTEAVDLSGWQLVDAVAYTIPSGTMLEPGAYLVVAGDTEALSAEHPDIAIVGDFAGRLANDSDRILLLDAWGNPADEVRYYDGGRWPGAADGGGSSLELRDPRADNGAAEAWAASDESAAWASYSYRGNADPSVVGPDGVWQELVLGLLDAGELLVDDISVIQDPDTAPVELIRNGSFDAGGDHWRLLGNHRHSEVVPDPDDAANPVLRLVATGPTGHMHNHAETTSRLPIGYGPYAISFRARWVSGSNQLNSRLYFNRLPHTTLVATSERAGTPGAPNSALVVNVGPTYSDLQQDVAVPAAGQPVRVSVAVEDPDGVASVALWTSVAGAAFTDTAMVETDTGVWSASIDGQAAGAIVQFYIVAEDGLGEASSFPAAGPDSRALIQFDDGKAATNGLHNFRLIMTEADSDWLLEDVNLMSDDLVGGTVVYDEAEVFYDVGVRTKGSQRGRPETVRLGYGVRFRDDQPFRGSRTSVLLDRSEGVSFGQREVLLNLVMTRAGSVSGEYNDLIQAITPRSEHTGAAELQLDRFSELMLDAQFEDGASGALFEYELIYYPTTTEDGSPDGLKLPQPDEVVGTSITDLGDAKEDWRWNFLLQNNEREDDYAGIVELGETFALWGPDFLAEADSVIDVDQWLRAFAFATLSGAVDNYGSDGSQHNAQFYVQPVDQRVLYFPHDLDYFGSASMSVVGNGDLARLIEDPVNRRAYYGHLQDIITRAYNGTYLAPWCTQLATLLPAQDFAYNCQFIVERADWVLNTSPEAVMVAYPAVDFHITTADGADFSVAATEVVLEGQAWVDVRQIGLEGEADTLELTWLDGSTWQVTVPLQAGPNEITLVATDLHGAVVGGDSVVVTSTKP